MKTITIAFATLALSVSLPSCKKVEKKRPSDNAAKPTTATDNPTKTDPGAGATKANPHANMGTQANPHAGMGATKANPHANMGAMPKPAGGPVVGETGPDGKKQIGPFTMIVPKSWEETPPASSMRLAEWKIGKDKPGQLALFRFGGGGGGVEANISRWIGQFVQDDGTPSEKKAIRKDEKIDGFPVTTLKLDGRFVAAVRPGAPKKHNEPNYALLGAIVIDGDFGYFFKLIGPKATLDAAEKDWNAMIKSIKKK